MAARVTQAEKEKMWQLYQKCGSIQEVAKMVKRSRTQFPAMFMNMKPQ